jgi:chromosome segregation ATPase
LNEQGERLVEIHRKLSDREVEVIALRADVAERDKSIERLRLEVADLHRHCGFQDDEIARLRAELADANENIVAKHNAANKVIAGLHAELAKRDDLIRDLQRMRDAGSSQAIHRDVKICELSDKLKGALARLARAEAIEAAARETVEGWYDHETNGDVFGFIVANLGRTLAAPSPAGDRAERDGAETASHGVEDLLRFEVVRLERELDRARSLIGDHKDAIASLRASLAAVAERERRLAETAREVSATFNSTHRTKHYAAVGRMEDALAAYKPTPEPAPAEAPEQPFRRCCPNCGSFDLTHCSAEFIRCDDCDLLYKSAGSERWTRSIDPSTPAPAPTEDQS